MRYVCLVQLRQFKCVYPGIQGERLHAMDFKNHQVEPVMRVSILNKITVLGMPQSCNLTA